ncbi:amidase family protein [Mycobacterium kansasii]|uniref:Amidase family protein n=1 Tax=Mycobacterium kansasii TaxID=1768 RepID=A0A1V3WUF9_MYCKA|nr:amidase family protein [Mycobacterium kansasii]
MRNPWDTTRETGGSSSGSGALVATGEVGLALGGDQGGSVRIPAALCGIVGLKPTYGLVPYTGAFPIERTIDHLGPMTRTVADAAVLLTVLAGPDGHDPASPRR